MQEELGDSEPSIRIEVSFGFGSVLDPGFRFGSGSCSVPNPGSNRAPPSLVSHHHPPRRLLAEGGLMVLELQVRLESEWIVHTSIGGMG